jgi:hypothetical protein
MAAGTFGLDAPKMARPMGATLASMAGRSEATFAAGGMCLTFVNPQSLRQEQGRAISVQKDQSQRSLVPTSKCVLAAAVHRLR